MEASELELLNREPRAPEVVVNGCIVATTEAVAMPPAPAPEIIQKVRVLPAPPLATAPAKARWIVAAIIYLAQRLILQAEHVLELPDGAARKAHVTRELRLLLRQLREQQTLLPPVLAYPVFFAIDKLAPRIIERVFKQLDRLSWVNAR